MKILMVCLGNICRSPLADGLMRQKVAQKQLDFEIDSAGTANYHIGSQADKRMIATAKKYGVDLSTLRARQFEVNDFDKFDIIYVMDKSNLQNVNRLSRSENDKLKVKLILNEIYPGEHQEVPDPYYGTQNDFEEVFELLDKTTNSILEKYT
ncbi:MAG: low molecular weight protein-tyrosine-phosphatase [Bacteroidota bacterium]